MRTLRLAPWAALLLLLTVPPATAQPALAHCSASTNATGQASVFTVPDGTGRTLADCVVYGGTNTDATITVTLRDIHDNPVVGYPAADLWLVTESDGLALCVEGSLADGPTDANGQTTFSRAIHGGGHSDAAGGERTVVMVGGSPLAGWELDILYNSPDLDGDLDVDGNDVNLFMADFGSAAYRSDFDFNGHVDLVDVALLNGAMGAVCYAVDLAHCEAAMAGPDPALVLVSPDGSGMALDDAWSLGEDPTSAEITVTIRDADNNPVVGYPAALLSLATEAGGLTVCDRGARPDGPTDASGQTTFRAPLRAGGYSDYSGGERTLVVIDGAPLVGYELEVYFHSPDINGDLYVDCHDLEILTQDVGTAALRSDFAYNGTVDLADVEVFSQHYGHNCLGLPDYQLCTVSSPASGAVSLFDVPDGSGDSLANALAPGGSRVDATISVTLRDSQNRPIVDYPAGDIFLRFTDGTVISCDDGLVADGPTDIAGQTTISGPFRSGGHAGLYPARLVVGECEVLGFPLELRVNSPDIDGDLVVDIPDLVTFNGDVGSAAYRSDFNFSGHVDLADFVLLSHHFAVGCDGPVAAVPPSTPSILHANVPNPFNPRTTIGFELRVPGEVHLAIYDPRGRLVRTLVDGERLAAGSHTAAWDGRDGKGRAVASGVYCYRLQFAGNADTRPMVLLR